MECFSLKSRVTFEIGCNENREMKNLSGWEFNFHFGIGTEMDIIILNGTRYIRLERRNSF